MNNVTKVGVGAFADCINLTSVVIPDCVTNLKYIGDGEDYIGHLVELYPEPTYMGVFGGCSGLTSVTIGSGVTELPDYAFLRCESLPEITIPNNVTKLGRMCFAGCNSLTSINIPSSVKSIGEGCFGDNTINGMFGPDYYECHCENLSAVTLNEGLEIIYDEAFRGCTALTRVNIPSTVHILDSQVFSGCTALTDLTLVGPEIIYSQAFYNCSSLTNVVIPDMTTELHSEAFMNCTSLTSVTIGSGVTTMCWELDRFWYGRQFVNCSSLCEIYAKPRVAPGIYDPFIGIAEVGTFHYPAGSDYSTWIAQLPSGWTAVADL